MKTVKKLLNKIGETRKLVKIMQNAKSSGRYKYDCKELDRLAESLLDLQVEVGELKSAETTGSVEK